MGYKTHNFLAGAKLSAQSLNEMDEMVLLFLLWKRL